MMSLLDANVSPLRTGGPSFSARHRVTRLAWNIIWMLFGYWTPTPFHAWRRVLLRAFGASIARTAKVYPGTTIWYPRNLIMADYSCIARGVDCYCMSTITLDSYALVSQGAYLCGGTHDIDDPNFQLVTGSIRIGANAWVAANAFVGPGVTIHEGAVLGACAVSMKDLAPWGVYAGNPAKFIRQRKH